MKVEMYKGRKLKTVKGKERGYVRHFINGVDLGRHQGNEESALTYMRNTINVIDEDDINGDRWAPEWYAPGTFEECEAGHAKKIGGECRHFTCEASASREVEPETLPVVESTLTADELHAIPRARATRLSYDWSRFGRYSVWVAEVPFFGWSVVSDYGKPGTESVVTSLRTREGCIAALAGYVRNYGDPRWGHNLTINEWEEVSTLLDARIRFEHKIH
ncbi:hypothetical protein [Streptomyces sp. NPDC102264]|uniref:hypothetical protein n=1 Tax=Streptomyces sp. NPDC102264 TaxID=3366149 RepID=UPI003808E282